MGKWVFLEKIYEILGLFSFILMYLHTDTHTHMRIQPNLTYDMIIALLCADNICVYMLDGERSCVRSESP